MVAAAIAQRCQESNRSQDTSTWNDVLVLDSRISDELDLSGEIKHIRPFLMECLPSEMLSLVDSTAYPLLSRHLNNSFGIWELPVGPESENLGTAMYPAASYFNHSCEPNVIKVRQGRTVRFVTCRDIKYGEELCISYGQLDQKIDERQLVLRQWWGFDCDCMRCKRELLRENTIQHEEENP